MGETTPKVSQLRVVIEVDDFDEARRFFAESLGLEEEFFVEGPDGASVVALQAGRSTLELINAAQREYIDAVEVGRSVAGPVRLAFEVDDVRRASAMLVDAGSEVIAPPTVTPWNSLNARLSSPAGTQITLFEELDVDPGGGD